MGPELTADEEADKCLDLKQTSVWPPAPIPEVFDRTFSGNHNHHGLTKISYIMALDSG